VRDEIRYYLIADCIWLTRSANDSDRFRFEERIERAA
jgi:hypothetical protein